MNQDELIVKQYLDGLGLGPVEFEPDGNIPPDFVVNRTIAVEVRRLNKHVEVDGQPQGLEQAEFPLLKLTKNVFKKLESLHDGRSFLCSCGSDDLCRENNRLFNP